MNQYFYYALVAKADTAETVSRLVWQPYETQIAIALCWLAIEANNEPYI